MVVNGNMNLICNMNLTSRRNYEVKAHWQQKISSFYIKVFDLKRQNIVVRCYENARNTF